MELTDAMLIAAMKEAVRLGIFPMAANLDTAEKNWSSIKKVLEAALTKQTTD